MPGRKGRTTLGRVLLGAGAFAFAAGASDDPPPLEPPADLPPLSVPTPPADDAPPADDELPPDDRPILAVPGLTRPAPMPAPPPVVIDSPPDDGPPPLVAPSGAPGPAPGRLTPLRPAPASRRPGAGGGILSLEPVPADGLDPLKPKSDSDIIEDDDPARPRSRPVPPPPRRGLFGLFTRPAPPPPVDEPIRVEPRDDPAADAALKRRIEAQVRRAVGDKTRSIDVRVADRKVYIRAQVQRFWQKRSVRRTLETLPALSGYRSVVDVVD